MNPHSDQVQAGKIVGSTLSLARELCKEPIEAEDLNQQLEEHIRSLGGVPALKGYKPPFSDSVYQHGICLSLNKEVVHGPPVGRTVHPEDVISVDLVVRVNAWHADAARTFTYSKDKKVWKFLQNCHIIFNRATDKLAPNMPLSTFGAMTEMWATALNLEIVQEFCGHGIGTAIHEDPQVYCFNHKSNERFQIGRSYAIEPIFAESKYNLVHSPDGWTVAANCLTAHIEDTFFISDKCIIRLTEEPEQGIS